MKLLVDMNLSPRWVQTLERNQFEAEHWSHVGDPKAPDAELMAHAARHDYVVLTNDLDFGAILAVTHASKPSVVQIRSDNLSPDAIGEQVVLALQQTRDQLRAGALVNVNLQRTRLRVLPLTSET
jgi:predicted nuclease of predicted toxin-antitoxin system